MSVTGRAANRSLTMGILVVEDEKDIRELIALHLRRAGFVVDESGGGEDAIQKTKSKTYDLIILDWMLPQLSGLEVLRHLRDQMKGHVPVLMLTAKAGTSDTVFGLESGADDYMTKPFEPVVLLARVRALLRRNSPEASANPSIANSEKISVGDLMINTASYEVFFRGEPMALTPSEFKLLHALASNKGRVLSREKLIQLVQGDGVIVVDRAIDTHVFGLRKKMGAAADYVETVRGIGYRMHSTN